MVLRKKSAVHVAFKINSVPIEQSEKELCWFLEDHIKIYATQQITNCIRYQNPVEHIRRSFFAKKLTAFSDNDLDFLWKDLFQETEIIHHNRFQL